jgi:hypothetical protein
MGSAGDRASTGIGGLHRGRGAAVAGGREPELGPASSGGAARQPGDLGFGRARSGVGLFDVSQDQHRSEHAGLGRRTGRSAVRAGGRGLARRTQSGARVGCSRQPAGSGRATASARRPASRGNSSVAGAAGVGSSSSRAAGRRSRARVGSTSGRCSAACPAPGRPGPRLGPTG